MLHAVDPRRESFALRGAALFEGFDNDHARCRPRPCGENVGEELPVIRALLDKGEVLRFTQKLPHFHELRGEKFSENRTDADAGEEIAATSGAIGL